MYVAKEIDFVSFRINHNTIIDLKSDATANFLLIQCFISVLLVFIMLFI